MEKKSPPFYASVVIINPMGEVLLGKRLEDGIWTSPGGSAEEGETPDQAACREVFEECGMVLPPGLLLPLPNIETRNNKICYCFLYRCSSNEDTTTKLDPDQEVKEWKWFSRENLPKGIEEDPRRFSSIRNGFMKFYGIIKAKLEKGGPGSGIQGHLTLKDNNVIHLTRKLEEMNPIQTQLHKLKNGAVFEGQTLRSEKPVYMDMDQATAHGYTPQDHREAANLHYDKAEAMSANIEKLRASKQNVPKEMEQIAKIHMKQFKAHMSRAGHTERRASQTEQAIKDKKASLNKSDFASNMDQYNRCFKRYKGFGHPDHVAHALCTADLHKNAPPSDRAGITYANMMDFTAHQIETQEHDLEVKYATESLYNKLTHNHPCDGCEVCGPQKQVTKEDRLNLLKLVGKLIG